MYHQVHKKNNQILLYVGVGLNSLITSSTRHGPNLSSKLVDMTPNFHQSSDICTQVASEFLPCSHQTAALRPASKFCRRFSDRVFTLI